MGSEMCIRDSTYSLHPVNKSCECFCLARHAHVCQSRQATQKPCCLLTHRSVEDIVAEFLSATIQMTRADGPVNERLWTLVLELSAQLAANKQQVDALRKQIASLEGQALHAKTGYALRRFNVDMSQEAFTSQLERLNAQLVNENTALAYEAKQMGSLLRESESTLEAIMNKFRAFSHAAQQHGLDLSAYYESRIESQRNRIDHLVMHDQDTMHRLSDLSLIHI